MFDGANVELQSAIIHGVDKYGRDRGVFGYRRPSELTNRDLELFRARYAAGVSMCQIANEFALSGPQTVKGLAERLQLPKREPVVRTEPTQWEQALAAVIAGCETAADVAANTNIPPAHASSALAQCVAKGKLVRTGERIVGTRAWVTYAVAPPQPEPPPELEKYVPLEREVEEVVRAAINGENCVLRPRYGKGMYLNDRCHWVPRDKALLKILLAKNYREEFVADVLGRSPDRIREAMARWGHRLPKAWKVVRAKPEPLMSYPFVAKRRADNADVLAVNKLVAHAYPEHMRADICQEIMLAILEGETTLEQLREEGVKVFVNHWRRTQHADEYNVSLDAPRLHDGRPWHDLLSSEHSVWLGEGAYYDKSRTKFRNTIRPKILGRKKARAEQEARFGEVRR